MDTHKQTIWKVHCPQDGPQLLMHTGLHVFVRTGLPEDVVTYFCPTCGVQRYQLVSVKVSKALIDDLGVRWTPLRVPLEALEPHNGAPLTEDWIDECLTLMARPAWPGP